LQQLAYPHQDKVDAETGLSLPPDSINKPSAAAAILLETAEGEDNVAEGQLSAPLRELSRSRSTSPPSSNKVSSTDLTALQDQPAGGRSRLGSGSGSFGSAPVTRSQSVGSKQNPPPPPPPAIHRVHSAGSNSSTGEQASPTRSDSKDRDNSGGSVTGSGAGADSVQRERDRSNSIANTISSSRARLTRSSSGNYSSHGTGGSFPRGVEVPALPEFRTHRPCSVAHVPYNHNS